jgi:hypothetical protein
MSENLDKIKALYVNNIDSVFTPDPKTSSAETIQAMADTLTEDEKTEFRVFMDDYLANQYDKIMSEFSPELKAMVNLFISDLVAEETGGTPSTGDQKDTAIEAVPLSERHLMRPLVSSQVVHCVISAKVREKQSALAH